jgi:hypothetical protein
MNPESIHRGLLGAGVTDPNSLNRTAPSEGSGLTDRVSIHSTVRYDGACDIQVRWGSNNDDPRPLLTIGTVYDVTKIEVHSMHTKIELHGFEGKKFNSASFTWADETVFEEALKAWREKRYTR